MKKTFIILLTIMYIFLCSCGLAGKENLESQGVTGDTEVETTTVKAVETTEVSYRDPDTQYLFFDTCDSLKAGEWTTSGISDHLIFADSKDNYEGFSVEPGQFGVYAGKETGTYASISKNIEIGGGPWIFEIRMDIKDLITPSSNLEWRGLIFDVYAQSKRYYIALNGNGYIYGQQGNTNTQKPLRVEGLKGFHTWRFIYNGISKIYVLVDDKLIGQFDGTWSSVDEPDSINIRNVPINVQSGNNEVYIDHIGFSKDAIPDWIESDPKIAFINVMPKADSGDFLLTARVDNMRSEWATDGNTRIDLFLMSGNETISETNVKLTSNNAYIRMNTNDNTGVFDLKAVLIREDNILYEYIRKLDIRKTVQIVPKGGQITSIPGEVHLFDRMDRIENYEEAGWKAVMYKYNGSDDELIGLDSRPSSGELEIPVEAVGWFGVYMGYLKGTQNIAVDFGEGYNEIEVEKTLFLPKDEVGDSTLKEVFIGAANFTGQKLKIRSINPKKARLAYIKFVGLNDNEIAEYQTPSDGVKRAIYNNDGYSDFCSGYYPNLDSLLQRTINIYKGKDVGIFEFCLGTTFALNHNSEIAGKPYANISQDAKDRLMRNIDKTAVNQIQNFSRQNMIPVEEVAKKADEYGIKTFASLRMNAFYDPNSYPWLNGNLYDQYADYRIKDSYGRFKFNISYASQTIRDLITNILVEAASFEGVDGVNLDFNRYPDCLGYEDELVVPFIEKFGFDPRNEMNDEQLKSWTAYKAGVFNDFMKTLRERLPDKEISVRIPDTGWQAYGFDLKTWIENKYIDILIPSNIGYESFFDIKPFTELAKDSDVLVYGGINSYLSGHDMTKQEEDMMKKGIKVDLGHSFLTLEQYLERAWVLYNEGCDGIHVFNNWSDKNIVGLLGDKQYVEKWHTFYYPALLKGEAVTIKNVE